MNQAAEASIVKIDAELGKIRERTADAEAPISGWIMRTADYSGPENYEHMGEWHDVTVGEAWPASPSLTAFFSARTEIPSALRGSSLYLDIDVGGESLLSVNGRAYHGLDRNRSLVKLEESVLSERVLELRIESAVDRLNYEFQFRSWGNNPVYSEHRFARARFVAVNRAVWDYYFDLLTARECCVCIPGTEGALRNACFSAIRKSTDALRYCQAREEFLRSVETAREILNREFPEVPHAAQPVIHMIGHSHIDVGYLWPVKDTVRKCSRTFSTALRLMDLYPQYRFVQSQPQLYEFTKQYYPEVFEGIRAKVQSGQWEPEGAMWVESDCNLPSGESLIRQILMGKQYFMQEFGYDCKVLWLPDTFGFPCTLPQIMQGCGLDYFATQKLSMNQTNKFPYDLFQWKSPDGSKVLALFTGDYNGELTGKEIRDELDSFRQDSPHTDYPILYGHGDGGGGVTHEMLEKAQRLDRFSSGARFTSSSLRELFQKLERTENLPVWDGELYLEAHRGVYTSHAELKKLNRRCEAALRDAEFFLCISRLNRDCFAEPLEKAWKLVLTNQFHDIIAGSTVQEVFDDAVNAYRKALDAAIFLKEKALDVIMRDRRENCEYFTVWNTLGFPRSDVVLLSTDSPGRACRVTDEKGRDVPCQITGKNGGQLAFAAELPSAGYRVYRVFTDGEAVMSRPFAGQDAKISGYPFENRYFRIVFGPSGTITSLWDKRIGRELIPKGKEANEFQIFTDEPPQYDAWEIEDFTEMKEDAGFVLQNFRVLEDGPLIKKVQIIKSRYKTKICQDIVLYDTVPRIDFKTEVDWHEDRKLLKTAFPVDIRATEATYDIAFGTVQRPTHSNTSWDKAKFEVPAHMWADLSEYGCGVSLLNDSKYGCDIKNDTIRLTLLKASVNPDPEADRGLHRFLYSLFPHPGSWQEGKTAQQAYQLNIPVTVIRGRPRCAAESEAFFLTDCPNVLLESVKPPEDGKGVILRLLEKYGKHSTVKIQCALPFQKVYQCNMLEQNEREISRNENSFTAVLTPFKIQTFRIV